MSFSVINTRFPHRLLRVLKHVGCGVNNSRNFYSRHKILNVHDAKISYYDSGK